MRRNASFKDKRGFRVSVSNFLSLFLIVLIFLNLTGLLVTYNLSSSNKQRIISISNELDRLQQFIGNDPLTTSLVTEQSYYNQLNDKTDAAIERLLTIVAMIASVATFFGILIAFKAPHDIDKRVDELRRKADEISDLAEESKYYVKLIEALMVSFNGRLTNYHKVRQISEIIEQYPRRPDAYIHRGFLYDEMRKYDLAISDYKIANSLGASKATYYNSMGIAQSNQKKHQDAIASYSKAIKLSPDKPSYYSNRGSSYDDIEQYNEALADYNASIELDDEYCEAFINRSITYQHLRENAKKHGNKEDYTKFLERQTSDLKTAIELNPDDETAQELLKKVFNETSEEPMKQISVLSEKIGDLHTANMEHTKAFEKYTLALTIQCNEYLYGNIGTFNDIVRVTGKLLTTVSELETTEEFGKSDELKDIVKVLSSTGVQLYLNGKHETAEQVFNLAIYIDKQSSASLNLAFMKRRGETSNTKYSVEELLEMHGEKDSAVWCVNKALCYVDGVEVEKDWKTALRTVASGKVHFDDAVDWWSDVSVVGEKESNIVLLLIHKTGVHDFQDQLSLEERYDLASEYDYFVPVDDI